MRTELPPKSRKLDDGRKAVLLITLVGKDESPSRGFRRLPISALAVIGFRSLNRNTP